MVIKEKTVKAIRFKGRRDKWVEWSKKVLAKAAEEGIKEGFTEDEPTGTDAEKAAWQKKTSAALNFLIQSCEEKPFRIVSRCEDGRTAWQKLNKKYDAKEVSDATRIQKQFNKCRLESKKDDPDFFFMDLEEYNDKLEDIGKGYQMTDFQMMNHVLENLPKAYETMKTVFSTKAEDERTYESLKTDVTNFYRDNLESDSDSDESDDTSSDGSTDSSGWTRLRRKKKYGKNHTKTKKGKKKNLAFNTETKQWVPKRQFKGRCRNCGKFGHKAADCPESRKCYNCGEPGHIAKDCPKKKENTRGGGTTSGMFVGYTHAAGRVKKDPPKMTDEEARELALEFLLAKTFGDRRVKFVPQDGVFVEDTPDKEENPHRNEVFSDRYLEDWDPSSPLIDQKNKTKARKKKTTRHKRRFQGRPVRRKVGKTSTAGVPRSKRGFPGRSGKRWKKRQVARKHRRCEPKKVQANPSPPMSFWMSLILILVRVSLHLLSEIEQLCTRYNNHFGGTMAFATVSTAVHRAGSIFLFDSGANSDIVTDVSMLDKVWTHVEDIHVGNNETVASTHKGSVVLIDPKTGATLRRKNVLVVPNFRHNILSVSATPGTTSFEGGKMFVFRGTSKEIEISPTDGLYFRRLIRKHQKKTEVMASETKTKMKKMDVNEAHQLFGHCHLKSLEKTCKKAFIKLTGDIRFCSACAKAKAKQKNVRKVTGQKATRKGQRLYLDVSGPFSETPQKSRYWLKAVDEYTRKSFDFFMQHKSEVSTKTDQLLTKLNGLGIKVEFIRCDNAGENKKKLEQVCDKHGVTLEYTAPHTPQMNGVVERRFAVDTNKALALMIAADLTTDMEQFLWAEAAYTSAMLGNMTVPASKDESPHEAWYGEPPKLIGHLQLWGRVAYVTKRNKIRRKWTSKAREVVFIGYAEGHPVDTYRFYDPERNSVLLSRDVQWSDWHGSTQDRRLAESNDQQKVDSDASTSSSDSESDDDLPPLVPRNLVSDDDESVDDDDDSVDDDDDDLADPNDNEFLLNAPDPGAGRSDTDAPQEADGAPKSRLSRELAKLQIDMSDGPRIRTPRMERGDPPNEIEDDAEVGNREDTQVYSAVTSDPGEPKRYEVAKQHPIWRISMVKELHNFIKRKAWTMFPREKLKQMGRKPIGTKWVYKVKTEPDGSLRYKSRTVQLGYQEVPGVDYTETFAPVAQDTTTRLTLGVALMKDWITESVDIEAAFTNADMATPSYVEWPKGSVELGLITEEERKKYCIRLEKPMYGGSEVPRMWWTTILDRIVEKLGFQQSLTDPCLFFKKDTKGELKMVLNTVVDDILVAGKQEDVDWFKNSLKELYEITEQGRVRKYLGIMFDWIEDEAGNPAVKLSMDAMIDEIVEAYEKEMSKIPKVASTPGFPGTTLVSNPSDQPVRHKAYRSIVGKVQYLASKIMPEIVNATRELARFMHNPGDEHWKAVERIVGYVGTRKGHGLILRRPASLRVICWTDANYATDPETRCSVSGMIATVGGMLTNMKSKTQTTTVLSTTESEYLAFAYCCQEMVFTQNLLREIWHSVEPGIVFGDNNGCLHLIKNEQVGIRTKHIDIRAHWIRSLTRGEHPRLMAAFVPTDLNYSDIATKATPVSTFVKLRDALYGGLLVPWREDVGDNARVVDTRVSMIQGEVVVEGSIQDGNDGAEDASQSEAVKVPKSWSEIVAKSNILPGPRSENVQAVREVNGKSNPVKGTSRTK